MACCQYEVWLRCNIEMQPPGGNPLHYLPREYRILTWLLAAILIGATGQSRTVLGRLATDTVIMDQVTIDKHSRTDYVIPGENWIQGVRHMSEVTPTVLGQVQRFPVHKEDVIICGFPKAGTGWVTIITQKILGLSQNIQKIYERFIDVNPEGASKIPRPDVFKSHLIFPQLPSDVRHGNGKIVCILRNPKDVAVSYYYFHGFSKQLGLWKGSWDVFFEIFLTGQNIYGSYFKYIRSFWEIKHLPNVFIVEYEDLKVDPSQWIAKIAEFLGKHLSDENVQEIVDTTEFNNMKRAMNKELSSLSVLSDDASYMRAGTVGDWRHLFSESQIKRMDDAYLKFCKDIDRPFQSY